jgi:glycosyltransferase involved in cell wall biosynthesis
MKRILFTGKDHRLRRRETILHPPKGIKFISQQPLNEMKKDYELSGLIAKMQNSKKMQNFLNYNNIIPKKQLKNIDLIYSPGKIILNRFPWVIEIDNVAVLTYYNLRLLRLLKPFIKLTLKSKYCKKIICISEAAKSAMQHCFKSKKINKKISVVYPYVKKPELSSTKQRKITFLFISTNFYLKGGKELLIAFDQLSKKNKNIELTIITKMKDISKDHMKIIEKNSKIKLYEASFSKEDLFHKFYSKSDVFVLPTYQDSFGMVILEAISAGLACITTDLYNLPELVEEGRNGYLITPPIYYFDKKTFQPNTDAWNKDLVAYSKHEKFEKVVIQLTQKMEIMINNPKMITFMKTESKKIFNEKFAVNIRNNNLKKALV